MWENCDLFSATVRNDQYATILLFFFASKLKDITMQQRCEASVECWHVGVGDFNYPSQTIFSVLGSR